MRAIVNFKVEGVKECLGALMCKSKFVAISLQASMRHIRYAFIELAQRSECLEGYKRQRTKACLNWSVAV